MNPEPFTLLALCDYSTDGLVEPVVENRISSVSDRIRTGRIDAPVPGAWTYLHNWAAVPLHAADSHLRRIHDGNDLSRCAGGHIAALDLPADRAAAGREAHALLRTWDELDTKPESFAATHDRLHNDPGYTLDRARPDWWHTSPGAIPRLAAALIPSGYLGHWITLPHLVDDLTELTPDEFITQWIKQRHLCDALVDRRGRWHAPAATCPCPLGERYLPVAARNHYIRTGAEKLYQLGPTDIAAGFTCHP